MIYHTLFVRGMGQNMESPIFKHLQVLLDIEQNVSNRQENEEKHECDIQFLIAHLQVIQCLRTVVTVRVLM